MRVLVNMPFDHTSCMALTSQGGDEGSVVGDVHNLPSRSELGLEADAPAVSKYLRQATARCSDSPMWYGFDRFAGSLQFV